MDPHAVLVWVHILLFVFWLGADLGVYIAAIWVKNPARTLGERVVLLQGCNRYRSGSAGRVRADDAGRPDPGAASGAAAR